MTTLREERLGNGLQITFTDQSNRYFGDYHRVCVVANITYDLRALPTATSEEATFRRLAIASFGEFFSTARRCDRMAVPSAEVDAVRAALVDDYLRHAAAYLARPDTPRALVGAELARRRSFRSHV